MIPDRRQFILGAITMVGGSAALVSCSEEVVIEPTVSNYKFYTQDEFDLISRLSDLIIPRTGTPGALDVNVPAYMDGLMSDWAGEDTQKAQRKTLRRMKFDLDQRVGGVFAIADKTQAEQVLTAYDLEAFAPETSFYEYRNLKQLIETVYASTEDGAIKEYDYQPVPGSWNPSVPIELN